MIRIYESDCKDFSKNGLGPLAPSSCTVSETLNGTWELTLEHPLDDAGKWQRLQEERIIVAPVPAAPTPRVGLVHQDNIGHYYKNEIYSINTKRDPLRLRSGPGFDYAIIDHIDIGMEVIVTDTVTDEDGGEWCEVIGPYGEHGFQYKSYLKKERTEEGATSSGSVYATGTVVESRLLRDQPFRIYRVVPSDTDSAKVTVYARHIFYDLMDNMIQQYRPVPDEAGATVAESLLTKCLSAHGFRMYSDLTTTASDVDLSNLNPVSAMLEDGGMTANYAAELARDWYDVFMVKRVGYDKDVTIRRGKNLKGITYDADITNVVTRIMPTGEDKNGNVLYLPEVYIASPRESEYVHPKWYRLEVADAAESDATDDEAAVTKEDVYQKLREAAQKEFDNGCDLATLTLTVDFVNCADTEEYKQYRFLQNIYIGDSVRVINSRIGVDTRIRMTDYTFNCLTLQYDAMTLGTLASTPDNSLITGKQLGNGIVTGNKIALSSVSAGKLVNGSVVANKIAAGAITAGKIDAGAVTADKIAAGAVIAEKISANAVTAEKIEAGAVKTDKLEAKSVTAEKLAANAVTADKIEAGAIKTDKLDANAVTAAKIAAGSIEANHIASHTITADKIETGTITAESGILADGVVGTAQIADGSITDAKIVGLTANKITAGTINGQEINVTNLNADNITAGTINGQRIPQLGEDKIKDGAVSGIKIVDGAVTTDKIGDNAVTADKVVAEAITADKIAANAVTANKILAGAVTTDKLDANAVTAEKIAAHTITVDQIASSVGSDLDISSNQTITLQAQKVEGVFKSIGADGYEKTGIVNIGVNGIGVQHSDIASNTVLDATGMKVYNSAGQVIGGVYAPVANQSAQLVASTMLNPETPEYCAQFKKYTGDHGLNDVYGFELMRTSDGLTLVGLTANADGTEGYLSSRSYAVAISTIVYACSNVHPVVVSASDPGVGNYPEGTLWLKPLGD